MYTFPLPPNPLPQPRLLPPPSDVKASHIFDCSYLLYIFVLGFINSIINYNFFTYFHIFSSILEFPGRLTPLPLLPQRRLFFTCVKLLSLF